MAITRRRAPKPLAALLLAEARDVRAEWAEISARVDRLLARRAAAKAGAGSI